MIAGNEEAGGATIVANKLEFAIITNLGATMVVVGVADVGSGSRNRSLRRMPNRCGHLVLYEL